jgi:aspartate aminotransferase
MLSQRAANLKTSPTLALVAKAKELQAQGHDVISLTVGEPDWPTLPMAAEAGIEAIKKGITKYTPANGTLELRQALSAKIREEIGVEYGPTEVMVGPGAKFVIFSALQMLCDPGDEVIVHTPYWVSYPTMIELANGTPKIVECDDKVNFKITPQALEAAITPKTKAFLFCSPSNPTGLMYSAAELKALAEVLRKHPRIVILSDDIYNRLVFDGTKVAPHLLQVAPDLKARLVTINGGSKAYSMTGWRIGWAAGPAALIRAMGDYQSQSTGSPSSISQHAALAAAKNSEKEIADVVASLIKRCGSSMRVLSEVPGFQIAKPDGAFYLWVNLKKLLGKKYEDTLIASDREFCDVLLQKYFVATVPGVECGSPGYMRLSFACSEDSMARAAVRMKELVSKLV